MDCHECTEADNSIASADRIFVNAQHHNQSGPEASNCLLSACPNAKSLAALPGNSSNASHWSRKPPWQQTGFWPGAGKKLSFSVREDFARSISPIIPFIMVTMTKDTNTEGCIGLLFGVTLGRRELAHYNAIKMSATGFIHSTSFKGRGNTIYICRKTFQTNEEP